jgi:hypothetical protein
MHLAVIKEQILLFYANALKRICSVDIMYS